MTTYRVTLPDGVERQVQSHRTVTHAVIAQRKGRPWIVATWCESMDEAATQAAIQHRLAVSVGLLPYDEIRMVPVEVVK